MDSTEIERRKYPRFNAEVPVDIGLIDQKAGKPPRAQFKGVARDISMEGLRLELHYPAPDIHSFAPKLIGMNRQFDLDLKANLGTKDVRGVGEVRWARLHPLPGLKTLNIIVFLKEMRDDGKKRWANFVMRQSKGVSQDVSCQQKYSGHRLIRLLYKPITDLISSDLSIDYILPVMFVSSSVLIYWFAEMRYYQLMIPCGAPIIIVLLIGSRSFSRKYLRPIFEIPHSFFCKLYRSLRGN